MTPIVELLRHEYKVLDYFSPQNRNDFFYTEDWACAIGEETFVYTDGHFDRITYYRRGIFAYDTGTCVVPPTEYPPTQTYPI